MTDPLRSKTTTIDIYIKLAQYPIKADEIRQKMREMLFERGFVTLDTFEAQVKENAIMSQKREGVHNPFSPEPLTIWQKRIERVRAFQTDYHFSINLPPEEFDTLVEKVVRGQSDQNQLPLDLTFNPELAPWEMLFEQGERYEALPPPELKKSRHHLEEIKVVLIRGMITDQLPLIGVAKKALSIADLRLIYKRRIGEGKIGGKAAGMLIAWKILQEHAPESGADISDFVTIPESYYLGTNVMYEFRRHNHLNERMNQKYKSLDEIRADHEGVVRDHLAGDFQPEIKEQLAEILANVEGRPMIVRSSSLLEDNFGSAFAGKYESYFCPNQGTPQENLDNLLNSIKKIYASTLNPDALLYRQLHGLIDYDERMAILIQVVQGERVGKYYFPPLAGVGFSQNPFRWNEKIRKEEGFLRMVWGMGTRAVDRVARDYPRLIALSHPRLRPETTPQSIKQYSQRFIDLINLETNAFETLPIEEVLDGNYPYLKQIASLYKDGYIAEMVSTVDAEESSDLVLTFDYLTKDRKFINLMRTALMRLEAGYGVPVDTEFAVRIVPKYPYPDYELRLLQCRPLSHRGEGDKVEIPTEVNPEDILFTEQRLVPNGIVRDIRYLIYVDPLAYRGMGDPVEKTEVGRVLGRVNEALKEERFVLMGPGRWGSTNLDLGVRVGFSDIYKAKVLIEIGMESADGERPELSYGTHFFQDLVEGGIYALPIHLDEEGSMLNTAFLLGADNELSGLSPQDARFEGIVRVIDLRDKRLDIYMDGKGEEAMGVLVGWSGENGGGREGSLSTF